MAAELTEEEVIERLLLVTFDPAGTDGGPYRFRLPVLVASRARKWRGQLNETMASLAAISPDSVEGNDAMADAELELVVTYDETGVLGGREWLEDHATDQEIDDLYRALLDKSFRFASSPTAVVVAIAQAVVASERAKSLSGPSGVSDLTTKSDSPSPRSTSSGLTARLARHASETSG